MCTFQLLFYKYICILYKYINIFLYCISLIIINIDDGFKRLVNTSENIQSIVDIVEQYHVQ